MASANYEFEPVGSASITAQGQITLPKSAREASGLGESCRVFVFVERDKGQILLTHEPLAGDLIELAAKAARRKRSSKA
jgi:bifunctional DNA-binding transcriptional regulator/antitoxin component of YhaV-PrlF toxin-antitoxin module